jgi:lipopolysaccharide transport protein LptA
MGSQLLALLLALDGGAAQPVKLSAAKLTLEQADGKATYSGGATAVRGSTTLTCDTLEVFFGPTHEVSRIVALGHVVAIDQDRQAEGDRADFDNLTGLLRVTGNPRGRQGNRRVTGSQLDFVSGDDTLVIFNAHTEANQGGSGVTIDAKRLTLRTNDSTATWEGAVKASRGPTTLTAPTLTARYDQAGEVTQLDARGGIETTEGDRWARGQRATYDVKRGLLVVTGNPEARQGATHLKGSRVTLRAGSQVVEVDNAVTVISVNKGKRTQ